MQPISQRLAGAVLVVALHGPVILGLLAMNLAPGVRRLIEPQRDTMVVLPLMETPKSSTAPTKGETRPGSAAITVPGYLKLPFGTPPAAARALGLPLFACTPENLRNLSYDERAKCLRLVRGGYLVMKDGLPIYVKPPGPEREGLSNSDIRARERNTADPCLAAKNTGTDCIHETLFGKGLW